MKQLKALESALQAVVLAQAKSADMIAPVDYEAHTRKLSELAASVLSFGGAEKLLEIVRSEIKRQE